jgi:hypothetical protein
MNEKAAELERRLRENKGRLVWPEFAEALATVLPESGAEAQRLSVAATDGLRAGFFKRVGSDAYVDRRRWDESEREQVEALLRRAAPAQIGIEYVLFHHLDRLTGAVLVDGASVLRDVARVWEVVREDLCRTSRGAEHGLCLELNHYGRRDELELVSWGDLVPPLGGDS